jgi:hypothetical protein
VKSRLPVALVLVGVVAALFYSNFLFHVLYSKTGDWFVVVSELEVPGEQGATLLRTTDVLCGLLVLVLLPYVWTALVVDGWRVWAVTMMAVFAVAGALAGIIRLPCGADVVCTSTADEVQRWLHDGLSIASQAAAFVAAAAVGLDIRKHGPRWLHWAAWLTFWVGGVAASVVFGWFAALDADSWQTGLAQRLQIGVTSAWLICLGVLAATAASRSRAAR